MVPWRWCLLGGGGGAFIGRWRWCLHWEVAVVPSWEVAVVPSWEVGGVCRPRYHPMEARTAFEEIGRRKIVDRPKEKVDL